MRRSALLVVIGWATLLALPAGGEAQDAKPPLAAPHKDALGDPLPPGAIARIGTTRYRVLENSSTVAVSPDGKRLAALTDRNDIAIWELPAWGNRTVIRAHNRDKKNPPRFEDLEFADHGRQIVTFDANQQAIYFFDVVNGKMLKKLPAIKSKAESPSRKLTVSGDQKTLVVGTSSRAGEKTICHVQVWDLASDKVRNSFEFPYNDAEYESGIQPNRLSADGRWLAKFRPRNPDPEGTADPRAGHLEIWDLTTGKGARKIDAETSVECALSPDGKWLAASIGGSGLRVYDAATGAEKHNIRLRRADMQLQFAPDGKSLWVMDDAGKLSQWDHVVGELMASYKAPTGVGSYAMLLFTPTSGILGLGECGDGALALSDIKTGKVLSPVNVPTSAIGDVRFLKNGELFIGCQDGTFAWWNPRTGAKLRGLKLEEEEDDILPHGIRGARAISRVNRISPGTFGAFYAVSGPGPVLLSNSGQFLLSRLGGHSFYNAKTGKLLYDDDTIYGSSVCFFDGDAKAASINNNNKIRIWNTRTGRDLDQFDLPLHAKELSTRLTVSPSAKHFAINTNNDKGIGRTILWDADLKKIVRDWSGHERAEAMAFSPDHRWFAAAAAGKRLHLTRVDSPKADFKLPLTTDINFPTFSPDGRQLACTSGSSNADPNSIRIPPPQKIGGPRNDPREELESRIYIYEVASKKLRLELAGHRDGTIACLGYAHDSALLASGSSDTTTLVWRAGLRAFTEAPASQNATPDEWARQFAAMAEADAKAAFQAMIRLVQTPTQTVKLLDAKIAPAGPVDTGGRTVAQWIADLGKNDFAVRSRADALLKKIGPAVAPELRSALPMVKDLETKRRVEELLNQFAAQEWTPQEVLHARAVEVLEALATPAARALLTRWAAGGASAVLTAEARRALARLEKL